MLKVKNLKVKILLIGPSECGKTALANFLSDTMETTGADYRPTQGVRILEFESQHLGSGTKESACEVELWDCAGDFNIIPRSQLSPNTQYRFNTHLLSSVLHYLWANFLWTPDHHTYTFESCWPALLKDSSGVVIVFNPDIPSHLKEVETWHSAFISSQSLQAGQCLLIAHHKPGSGADTSRPPLAPQLNKLPLIHSTLEEDPEAVRHEFCTYLENVVQCLSESREREEMSIIA